MNNFRQESISLHVTHRHSSKLIRSPHDGFDCAEFHKMAKKCSKFVKNFVNFLIHKNEARLDRNENRNTRPTKSMRSEVEKTKCRTERGRERER